MTRDGDLEADIQRVIKVLGDDDAGSAIPREVVERMVRACFADRHDARVKDFVGLFAERSARERLRMLSARRGLDDREVV